LAGKKSASFAAASGVNGDDGQNVQGDDVRGIDIEDVPADLVGHDDVAARQIIGRVRQLFGNVRLHRQASSAESPPGECNIENSPARRNGDRRTPDEEENGDSAMPAAKWARHSR
jgi:hypothetical protein